MQSTDLKGCEQEDFVAGISRLFFTFCEMGLLHNRPTCAGVANYKYQAATGYRL
jgi:hypothetical protein